MFVWSLELMPNLYYFVIFRIRSLRVSILIYWGDYSTLHLLKKKRHKNMKVFLINEKICTAVHKKNYLHSLCESSLEVLQIIKFLTNSQWLLILMHSYSYGVRFEYIILLYRIQYNFDVILYFLKPKYIFILI